MERKQKEKAKRKRKNKENIPRRLHSISWGWKIGLGLLLYQDSK